MQTSELVRSTILCMESHPPQDPRCLSAAQELHNIIVKLDSNQIRSLCSIGNAPTTTMQQQNNNNNNSNNKYSSNSNLQKQPSLANSYEDPSSPSSQAATGVPPTNANNNTSRSVSFDLGSHHNQVLQSQQPNQPSSRSTSASIIQQQSTEALLGSLPAHLVGFAGEAMPPLHIRTLVKLAGRCYSGVAGFQHPSLTVESVSQLTLVTLRLCVAADAIQDPRDVLLLCELALSLGAGRTDSVPSSSRSSSNGGAQRGQHPLSDRDDDDQEGNDSEPDERQQSEHHHHNRNKRTNFPAAVAPVSVLAAVELFLVALFSASIGPTMVDAALSASSRHWLSAWLVRIEDGSATQPIEIFHRLCCFQRILTLRPGAAASCFAAHGFHDRVIRFISGEGALVRASSVGASLHLLAQMVEHGPQNLMMKFVSPKLIELHIASWAASEWTETLEGAFVLLTACLRLGLSTELWRSVVHANLHLVCAHTIGTTSIRVAASAASCLRTMLFLCQRELDIGLSIFFDTLAAPNIFRILDNHYHQQHPASSNINNNNKNVSSKNIDQIGLKVLTTECALIVAVFASFTPQHKVAVHHVACKLNFPLAMQRAQLIASDADVSLFVSWTLFDEHGRSVSGVDDPEFNQILQSHPLSQPPPGTTPQEWTDAAYVKFCLQKALQKPTDYDISSIFGFQAMTSNGTGSVRANHSSNLLAGNYPTNPKPAALGSKELSLALLKWFAASLQIVAATEGKASASATAVMYKSRQLTAEVAVVEDAKKKSNNNSRSTSEIQGQLLQQQQQQQLQDLHNNNEGALDMVSESHSHLFESCVNLILRFAKCAPVNNNNKSNSGGNANTNLNVSVASAKTARGIDRRQQSQPKNIHADPTYSRSNSINSRSISVGTATSTISLQQNNSYNVNDSFLFSSSKKDNNKNLNNNLRTPGVARASTASSSSRPGNETGLRRTHLFAHPYMDYYMNAQKKNAYTPVPVIPPTVRRWSLEDIQKSDLFSFVLRLDGLDQLVEKSGKWLAHVRERKSQQRKSTKSEQPSQENQQQQNQESLINSALQHHREEVPDDFEDDGEEDEMYEEEVCEEEIEEEEEQDDDDDDDDTSSFSLDDKKNPSQNKNKSKPKQKEPKYVTVIKRRVIKHVRPKNINKNRIISKTVPSSSSSTAAVAIAANNNSAARNSSSNINNDNNNANNQVSQNLFPSPSAIAQQKNAREEELLRLKLSKVAHEHLRQRMTALLADCLQHAEVHLLRLNEKTQCCPTKQLARRAFLVDMINNVMPAIISMLTMLFSIAKRGHPTVIYRVAKRIERADACDREGSTLYFHQKQHDGGSVGLNQTSQSHHQHLQQESAASSPRFHGSIQIHPGNLCAISFQLEMELAGQNMD